MGIELQAIGVLVLDTLMAVAAMLLGLSLVVQVIQEIWKFLSSSEARTYRSVLRDFFGPWVERLYESGPATRLQVRGPFQFFRSRPTGSLLPLEKNELLEAMDSVAGDWLAYLLDALKAESRLQGETPQKPSPLLRRSIVNVLRAAGSEGGPGEHNAGKVSAFLKEWGVVGEVSSDDLEGSVTEDSLDAGRLIQAFYEEFFPDRTIAEREFRQLARNFEHAYQRRNLRQTFVFALALAIGLNFPFDALYERASNLSPAEAAQLAQTMIDSEARTRELLGQETPQDAEARQKRLEELDRLRQDILTQLQSVPEAAGATDEGEPDDGAGFQNLLWTQLSSGRYWKALGTLWNCLITALLISFGAPFWHRLTKALFNVRQPKAERLAQQET